MSVSIIMGLALALSEDKFPNIRLSVELGLSLPPHTRGGSASRLVVSSATAPHRQSRSSCCA